LDLRSILAVETSDIAAVTKPLKAVDAAEFLALELQPREMLLEPILREKDLAMVHAWRGTGKTWFGLGLAVAVATGEKFLHRWEAPKPAAVLFVDGEMPQEAKQERLRSLLQAAGVEKPKAPLRIITPDIQEHGIPSFATPEGQALLERHLDDVALVILDHHSALFRGVGENEPEAAEPAQEFMLRLRRRGISVVLMHHSGKTGQQRGTSRREDVLDLVLNLGPCNTQCNKVMPCQVVYESVWV
jgi:putative DNA primase/helicase